MTHAISSPPFLFAHTIFTSATLYQETGKQVSSQTATLLYSPTLLFLFTITFAYFWKELQFYQLTLQENSI